MDDIDIEELSLDADIAEVDDLAEALTVELAWDAAELEELSVWPEPPGLW